MSDVRKEAHYGNILLLDPQGEPLVTIGERKAAWYLRKGLGEACSFPGYPSAVKLFFEPRQRGRSEFLRQWKENQCVCCGTRVNLTLHHVVPQCLRKRFPLEHKGRQSAWCVLLCVPCHGAAEEAARAIYASSLEAFTRLPVPPQARAWESLWNLQEGGLLRTLPPARVQELCRLAETSLPVKAPPAKPGIEEWASQFIEQNGIAPLKSQFRNAFLKLQPRFLPPGFLEDHN